MLRDILDGLFHIAKADGIVHEREMAFLSDVAAIFGITDTQFDRIKARHVHQGEGDPWDVLGIAPDTPFKQAQQHYRMLVRDNHPDTMMARGVPREFAGIAHDRIAAINAAWDAIEPELKRQ